VANSNLRLIDLEPKRRLPMMFFLCPRCINTPNEHKLGVDMEWGDLTQDFGKMSLPHSVRVLERPGCDAHFFITNGEIKFC
jgi:hypothetical protein